MNLAAGDAFPDVALPDQDGRMQQLSSYTQPTTFDRYAGFKDGYPLIVVFYRGFFCPRDLQQMRQLVQFYDELQVSYAKMVAISADEPKIAAAYRKGLGAAWPFLSDSDKTVIKQLDILDETEGEYAYPAQPYTLVLKPDMRIHRIYNGWYFAGRPTNDELRHDLREVMQELSYYTYQAWAKPEVTAVRIPQQTWQHGANTSGRPLHKGVVESFDSSGNGFIRAAGEKRLVFFNFSAIPGEGNRELSPGTPVQFEIVENVYGQSARNVQNVEIAPETGTLNS